MQISSQAQVLQLATSWLSADVQEPHSGRVSECPLTEFEFHLSFDDQVPLELQRICRTSSAHHECQPA